MRTEPLSQRDLLAARQSVAHSLRSTLARHGYLEAATPIVETAGSAHGRPFRLRSAAFGPLQLRTVAEPYLKRLVAGGVDRVFDLARSFRDEPADITHNLEYTLLEAYQAAADWTDMQTLAAELIRSAATELNGTTCVSLCSGDQIDLAEPWPERSLLEAISSAASEEVTTSSPRGDLVRIANRSDVPVASGWSRDRIILALYEELVEPFTLGPVFYTGFPASLLPQAAPVPGEPVLAQQWDLVIDGCEVATGATELTDHQLTASTDNWTTPGSVDRSAQLHPMLSEALAAGLPPCAGLAVGFDRLVRALTGQDSLRAVIPFPTPLSTGATT